MSKQQFQIKGMHCVGCAMTVDGALEDLSGVKSATTSYAKQVVEVEYDAEKLPEALILKTIENVGYQAQRIDATT